MKVSGVTISVLVAMLTAVTGYMSGYSHRGVIERTVSGSPVEAMLREIKREFDEGNTEQARRKVDKLHSMLAAYHRGGGVPPDRFYHDVIGE
jgi:hypothetical protein